MTARHLTPSGKWSDNPRHPWAVGWALPFTSMPPVPDNDVRAAPIPAVTAVITTEDDNAFVEVEGEGHPAAGRTYVYDRCDLATARREGIALADWYELPVEYLDATGRDGSPSIMVRGWDDA